MWFVAFILLFPFLAHAESADVMRYGAVGDGRTDDTAAIESALADGPEVHFPAGFAFLTDGHVIRDPKKLTCGQGAVLKQRAENLAPNEPEQILSFTAGSSGSVLEGCILDGNRDVVKTYFAQKERACLVLDAPRLMLQNIELRECMSVGLYAASETEKPGLTLHNISIHDTGLGMRVKHIDFAQITNLTLDTIQNESIPVFQHGVDIWHSEGFQLANLRITNMGGDTDGLSTWTSGLTIIESTGQITNLYLADVIAESLSHIGVSILSSTITGSNWQILGYGGTPLELQSNAHFSLSDFLIDCKYQIPSQGVTIGVGGQYFSAKDLTTRTNTNFYGRETHLTNGVIKRCRLGVRQSAGNLFLSNIELTGMVGDGLFASDNYGGEGSFPNAPLDTELSGTVLSNVTARYNGGAGLRLENANTIQIHGGLYENNGQDPAKAGTDRGGIVDSNERSAGPVFITGAVIRDTQVGTVPANASVDWSMYTGPFVAGDTIQFLLTKSVDYFEGQRIGLLNACVGVNCSVLGDDDVRNDLIVRIVDMTLDLATAVIVTPSGSYVEVVTIGDGTLTTSGSGIAVTGSGTSLDTQIRGPSWVKANGQYRRVNRAANPTTAKLESAFTPHLTDAPFVVSQVATQLIPSQQYGVRLQRAKEAQLIGNRITQNVTMDQFIINPKQFITADANSPLMAERIGPNAVKFAVQVGGNNLGLMQKGNGPTAQWVSGSVSGKGYTIANGLNFGIKDAFVLTENTLAATFAGTIQSTRPTDLGWKIQRATNQDCNTTCTTGACVFGFDMQAPGWLVECQEEGADVCQCAG